MLTQYHIAVTTQALEDKVSRRALEVILAANIAQDNLSAQIGHPEFHFDNNAIEAGRAYIEEQRQIVCQVASQGGGSNPAWEAFGRLTHAAQDFYAHSNYLQLWMQRQDAGSPPPPAEVEALDPDLLNHPALRSGHVYMVEALSIIPPLRAILRRILPSNSHAKMNLDSPDSGELFPYALEAARQRSAHEFSITAQRLRKIAGQPAYKRFTDR